jgi:hypothetical protein
MRCLCGNVNGNKSGHAPIMKAGFAQSGGIARAPTLSELMLSVAPILLEVKSLSRGANRCGYRHFYPNRK